MFALIIRLFRKVKIPHTQRIRSWDLIAISPLTILARCNQKIESRARKIRKGGQRTKN